MESRLHGGGGVRKTKYVDRIYFCKKKHKFIHVKWDHSIDHVSMWFFTDYHGDHGYISGKLITPKSWVELGWLPEGTISEICRGEK